MKPENAAQNTKPFTEKLIDDIAFLIGKASSFNIVNVCQSTENIQTFSQILSHLHIKCEQLTRRADVDLTHLESVQVRLAEFTSLLDPPAPKKIALPLDKTEPTRLDGAVGGIEPHTWYVDITQETNPYAGFQNTCSEECLAFLCNQSFLSPPEFDTPNYKFDEQIDLIGALSMIDCPAKQFFKGFNENLLWCFFTSNNKNNFYLLRSGTNSGAGHNSILFYSQLEWHVYSSETNQIQITSDDALTEAGKDYCISDENKWGEEADQYSITCTKLPCDANLLKPLIEKLIKFVNVSRTEGESAATKSLFKQR